MLCSDNRVGTVRLIAAAVAVLAVLALGACLIPGSDAADGDHIEYKHSDTNYVVAYYSDGLSVGSLYIASVTDSDRASVTAIDPYFGHAITDRDGNKLFSITLKGALADGIYDVVITNTGNELVFTGPVIVGSYGLSMTQDRVSKTVGDTFTLGDMLTTTPAGLEGYGITWSSSDTAKVRITQSEGEWFAQCIGVGDATVTASFEYNGSTVSASMKVSVNPVKVSTVTISGENEVSLANSKTLTITVNEGASGYSVEWSATPMDAVVITGNATGATVVGVKLSESVTITATVNNYDGSTVTGTHTMKVVKVPVTSVEVVNAPETLAVNNSVTLSCQVTPSDATDKRVTWSSSDDTVATVSQDGTVNGIGSGNVIITATSVDNGSVKDTVTIAVQVVRVTGVTLDRQDINLTLDGGSNTANLSYTISPGNATDKSVTWESSDTDVATVTNGRVTAVGMGDAIITVMTTDGDFTASCNVHVIDGYEVSFDCGTGGRVDPTPLVVNPGEDAVFTVIPSSGYEVLSVVLSDGTVLVPVNGVYTIRNVMQDMTVVVTFSALPEPDDPPFVPFPDDDPYVPPVIVYEPEEKDDTTTIAAIAAAAVAAVLIVILLAVERRR